MSEVEEVKPEVPTTEKPAESAENGSGKPEPEEASPNGQGTSATNASKPVVAALSAEATPFVPPAAADDSDIIARLPAHFRSRLRTCYQAPNGEYVSYYVGKLKSYNNRTGYGFLECKQAKADWASDVFIHKSLVPVPWNIGQMVEFAVYCNSRGQPQATDCLWLPRLPQNPVQVPASGSGSTLSAPPRPTASAILAGGAPARAESATDGIRFSASTPAAKPELDEPRRLGTLKSFSSSQGYGFLACDEVLQAYSRDTYVDKSQMPTTTNWRMGQTIEFSVSFNSRGHPQARRVNWDPIPLLPSRDQASIPIQQRTVLPATTEKLKKLLRLLHDKQVETAVVTAIDLQGGSGASNAAKSEDQDSDVDYVIFVLDRLGPEEDVLKQIKDFVKMLFILMLAKMMRTQVRKDRTEQLIKWFQGLATTIQVSSDSVKQHFQDVVTQISNHLGTATTENADLSDPVLSKILSESFQTLKAKAAGGTPAEG
jgi:cold shock CspA family protein